MASTPVASVGRRLGARALDAVLAVIVLIAPFVLVSPDRRLAQLFIGVLAIAAYEAAFVIALGATPGKLIGGLRVIEVDHAEVAPGTAAWRGLLIGLTTVLCLAAPVLAFTAITAPLLLVVAGVFVSVFASPLRRGFIDRLADTFVVDRTAPALITTDDLTRLTGDRRPPAVTAWGPAATFEQRRRARASRLDNAPVLVLALLAVAFAGSVADTPPWALLLLGTTWVVLFVLDEAWRLSRYGGTGGHRRVGLAVVDVATGEAPAPAPALVRAVLVAMPLYVLPFAVLAGFALVARSDRLLWLLPTSVAGAILLTWLAWARAAPDGRALHDRAAHTVVVAPATLRRPRTTGER